MLHRLHGFWGLIIIDMMRRNQQQNGNGQHDPTNQFNNTCKYGRHYRNTLLPDRVQMLPGGYRKASAKIERFQLLGEFSANTCSTAP